jgi:hypothetical protein
MLVLKILATVAYIGLYAYYIMRIRKFYAEASDAIGSLDFDDVDAKLNIYTKYVGFSAPILEAFVMLATALLFTLWIVVK